MASAARAAPLVRLRDDAKRLVEAIDPEMAVIDTTSPGIPAGRVVAVVSALKAAGLREAGKITFTMPAGEK